MRLIKLFEEWCVDVYESRIDYLPFEETKEYVQSLGLKNMRQWKEWSRLQNKPENIPASPHKVYKDKGWISWGDFLGTGNVSNQKRDFLPFEEAREYARTLGLKSRTQWEEWLKLEEKPSNIPAYPTESYENKGWTNWPDFLGIGKSSILKGDFLPFEEAREYVQSLGFRNTMQWKEWARTSSGKRPSNIPASPDQVYGDDGWISWIDFLGLKNVEKNDYVSYDLAKEMIQPFEIKTPVEWSEYYRLDLIPKNIPKSPSVFYANNGWIDWEDFLGSRKIYGNIFATFKEAREYAQSLGLDSEREWYEWANSSERPENIPPNPHITYQNKGWVTWSDWLGNKTEIPA